MSVFGVTLVRIQGNTDQNNSEYGHFLRRVSQQFNRLFKENGISTLSFNNYFLNKNLQINGVLKNPWSRKNISCFHLQRLKLLFRKNANPDATGVLRKQGSSLRIIIRETRKTYLDFKT